MIKIIQVDNILMSSNTYWQQERTQTWWNRCFLRISETVSENRKTRHFKIQNTLCIFEHRTILPPAASLNFRTVQRCEKVKEKQENPRLWNKIPIWTYLKQVSKHQDGPAARSVPVTLLVVWCRWAGIAQGMAYWGAAPHLSVKNYYLFMQFSVSGSFLWTAWH